MGCVWIWFSWLCGVWRLRTLIIDDDYCWMVGNFVNSVDLLFFRLFLYAFGTCGLFGGFVCLIT